jgi:hypothetical protein
LRCKGIEDTAKDEDIILHGAKHEGVVRISKYNEGNND